MPGNVASYSILLPQIGVPIPAGDVRSDEIVTIQTPSVHVSAHFFLFCGCFRCVH